MQFDADKIREAVTPRDVLQAHGLNFAGDRGPCPLCGTSERSTSFSLAVDGRWRCFACGEGGDSIALEQQISKTTFPLACQALCARAGLTPGERLASDIAAGFRVANARGEAREARDIANAQFRGRMGYLDRLRRAIDAVSIRGATPLGWDCLKLLRGEEGRVEAKPGVSDDTES